MGTLPPHIGPYRVLRPLGGGGFAEVLLGEDTRERRHLVALKRVRQGLKKMEPFYRESLISEGLMARRVDSPHVVRVDGMIEYEGEPVLVLEYIEGFGLDTLLRQVSGKGLEPAVAVAVMVQLCLALQALHEVQWEGQDSWAQGATGIVHQDLKPANVRITEDGLVKVLDLGIAVLEAQPVARIRQGTPGYRSPEQMRGEALLSAASDLYTLGILFYEMLRGVRLFPDAVSREPQLYHRAQLSVAPRLDEELAQLPAAVRRVLGRLLAVDIERRYARARDVRRDLDALAATLPPIDLARWCRGTARALRQATPVWRRSSPSSPVSSSSSSSLSELSMDAMGEEPLAEAAPTWESTPTRPIPSKEALGPSGEVTEELLAQQTEPGPPRPRLPPRHPTAEGVLPDLAIAPGPHLPPRRGGWRGIRRWLGGAALVLVTGWIGQWGLSRRSGEVVVVELPPQVEAGAPAPGNAPPASAEPVFRGGEAPPARPAAPVDAAAELFQDPRQHLPRVGGLVVLADLEGGSPHSALVLESVPAEARVSLRGQPIGTTPLQLEDLPTGAYTLVLEHPETGSATRLEVEIPPSVRLSGIWDFSAGRWR